MHLVYRVQVHGAHGAHGAHGTHGTHRTHRAHGSPWIQVLASRLWALVSGNQVRVSSMGSSFLDVARWLPRQSSKESGLCILYSIPVGKLG